MLPEELYTQHVSKADDVAVKLCYYYRVSGALPYRDEAQSHARIALWKQCVSFDPAKQVMQCREEEAGQPAEEISRRVDEFLAASIFGYLPPVYLPKDPYARFWMASITRVRGAVLDFFRAEKLIRKLSLKGDLEHLTKKQIKEIQQSMFEGDDPEDIAAKFGFDVSLLEELKPSMLYYAKFLSLSQPLSDFADGSYLIADYGRGETLGDMLPTNQNGHSVDNMVAKRSVVNHLTNAADLTGEEMRAIKLHYLEDWPLEEAAFEMGIKESEAKRIIASAIVKMRCAAEDAHIYA